MARCQIVDLSGRLITSSTSLLTLTVPKLVHRIQPSKGPQKGRKGKEERRKGGEGEGERQGESIRSS